MNKIFVVPKYGLDNLAEKKKVNITDIICF